MSDYFAVTTFSPAGFEVYGRRFIETFLGNWDIPLVCFYEGKDSPRLFHTQLHWLSLDTDRDRHEFIRRFSSKEYNRGPDHPNSQAVRFCHKVFAVTYPWHEIHHDPGKRMLWIDADVETTEIVNEDAMQEMLPLDASLSFLGRKSWSYTECGFVGYNLNDPLVVRMLEDMRRVYTSGELVTRPASCWHDSATFDLCRLRSGIPLQRQCNLTVEENGIHPWPCSVLGRYMRHHKGPGRKMRVYGGICE